MIVNNKLNCFYDYISYDDQFKEGHVARMKKMHQVLDKDQVADSCEHSNEPSGMIKGGEFLD
jgi:hypothetical protein